MSKTKKTPFRSEAYFSRLNFSNKRGDQIFRLSRCESGSNRQPESKHFVPTNPIPFMVNIDTLCPGCMTDKEDSPSCRTCGEEHLLNSSPQALPIRTIINDRFLIGRVLGRPGGFGITYLAWDMSLHTTAAIKEFLPACSVSRESGQTGVIPNSSEDQTIFSEGLQMFLEEARTLARFSHPNITRIRDYFTANNTAYLVMEYHDGEPLDQYVRQFKGPLSEDQSLEIMMPILDGLKAVHEEKFLHRDIKPQNIYLTENRRPILLDFGAARYAVGNKTSTLTVMLTSGFAPFEQYHQKGCQGPWTDLYACAATLYFLTTGKVPPDALERQYQDTLTAPIQLNPRLSESFNYAILKALAVDYRDRPKTVANFLSVLLGTSPAASFNPMPAATQIRSDNQTTVQRPLSIPTSVRTASKTVALTHLQKKEVKSSPAKLLVGILLLLFAFLIWKPTENKPEIAVQVPQTQNESMLVNDSKSSEPDRKKEQFTLSYADMPKIEPVGGTYFPETEEQTDAGATSSAKTVEAKPMSQQSFNPSLPLPPVTAAQALHACLGSRTGMLCRFAAPNGTVHGRCNPTPEGPLICVPAPPPQIGSSHPFGLPKPRRR